MDSDGDGTADCNDDCPNDPLKTAPGICGCGTPDTDSDGDGLADCIDPCPLLANLAPGNACDDGNVNTINDVVNASCQCVGTLVGNDCNGVPGGPAVPGTPCDDLNACTTGDVFDISCNCVGTPVDPDDNNACTVDTCDPLLGVINTPIDPNDGDPCTLDTCDPITGVSNVFQDADGDGTCDANDVCPGGPEPGQACDDGSLCTVNDVIDANCNCVGTPVDPDDNNACTVDTCDPLLGVINTPIDPNDGDPCTLDTCDPITGVSNAFQDADGDGTCDANDLCPGGPEPGQSCDDQNASTVNDVVDANCICAGTPLVIDCNGVPGGPALPGTACDDGNSNTINDVFDNACTCAGTISNNPPVALDDTYNTGFGQALSVNAINGLLSNDSDPDADPITVIAFGATSLGNLAVFADGSFTYTPNAGASGAEVVSYTISDGFAFASAQLTINIASNNAPVAVDDTYNTGFGQALSVNAINGLLSNDSDPDADPITVIAFGATSLGNLAVFADGSFTYTPNAGASGAEVVSYTISDGFAFASAQLTINIASNNAPVAVDDTYNTGFGQALSVNAINGLLSNDSDPDADPITVISFGATSLGNLAVFADGSFTYTPNAGASGAEVVSYTISDGFAFASAQLTDQHRAERSTGRLGRHLQHRLRTGAQRERHQRAAQQRQRPRCGPDRP